MLNEAKLNCQAMDPFYEPELCRLIQAGLTVLRTRGISFEGTFEYETEQDDDSGMPLVVGHTCTVTDDWIRTAVLNYELETKKVVVEYGALDHFEKYMQAFTDTVNMMIGTTGYGLSAEDDGGSAGAEE